MDLPLENVKKNIFSKTRIVVFSWLQLQPPFIVSCPICSHKIPWSSHCSFTSPCQTPCPIPSGRGYSFPVRSQTTELLELTEAIRAWCDALELMARQLSHGPWHSPSQDKMMKHGNHWKNHWKTKEKNLVVVVFPVVFPLVSSLGHPVFVAVATSCAWMHWVPATRCDQPHGSHSDFWPR